MHSQDCERSSTLAVHFGKSATVSVFVWFSSAVFVCVRHNQSGYLRFRKTKFKNTKLTLAVISFQVGQNNSSIFLALETYDKKVAPFPFLPRNTIPCRLPKADNFKQGKNKIT